MIVAFHAGSKSQYSLMATAGSTQSVYYRYSQHFQQSMHQPHMVASAARGQLKRENVFFPVPDRVREFDKHMSISSE